MTSFVAERLKAKTVVIHAFSYFVRLYHQMCSYAVPCYVYSTGKPIMLAYGMRVG